MIIYYSMVAHGRMCLYFTMARPFRSENCPFLWGICTPI